MSQVKWQDLRNEWNKDPKRRAVMRSEFPYRHLADELVALRASLGLTQAQLALKMKTSQSVVARFESGRRPITTKTLSRVATAVGMNWRISFESAETATVEAIGGFAIEVPRPRAMPPLRACLRSKQAGTNRYTLAA